MEFVIAWLNSPGILILRLQDVPFDLVSPFRPSNINNIILYIKYVILLRRVTSSFLVVLPLANYNQSEFGPPVQFNQLFGRFPCDDVDSLP